MIREKLKDIESEDIHFVEANLYSKPNECAEILKKINADKLSAIDSAYFNKQLGLQALNNGEYFKAYQFIQQSIKIAKEANFQQLVDAGYINLSAIYYYTKQYKKAIHNAFTASRSDNKTIQSLAYQNLGSYYELTEDYDKAMIYNNKSIALANELNKPDTNFAGLINSGNIMMQLGKQKEAFTFFKDALEVTLKEEAKLNYSDAYVYLAGYYNQFEEFEQAIKYAQLSLQYTDEFNVLRNYPKIYFILINSYYQQGNIKKAKQFLSDFFKTDSFDSDDISQTSIYDLQIEIEQKTAGAESALKAAKEKIKFLERKDELAKKQTELYRQFKEEENEKIEESRIKLAQSNKELLNIAKILAHDIKTPVRTLGSFSELLKKELDELNNPIANEYLDFITDASINLYTKLESALSLVLMEIKMPLEVIELDDYIKRANKKFKELEVKTPKALPQIKSNKNLINNLLYCIFENAIEYNSKANPCLTITSKSNSKSTILVFEDNGDGIAIDDLNKVFNIFYSSNPSLKKGIGLSICKKIVELHNGSIKIESAPKIGSKLTVELPI